MAKGSDLSRRTHGCGELKIEDVSREVILAGWVHRIRDHGGVVFIDLRDRQGITQLVIRAEDSPEPYQLVKEIRPESVIGIAGKVLQRGPENINSSLSTGQIEVRVKQLEVFNLADPLPFPLEGQTLAGEELRLKYRYLDLRRPKYQNIFRLRHRVSLAVRRYLDEREFLEIETPALTKSTPEGSREYLVPSRINPGSFYSLPQSPQLFKQILMISGFDRYFQIARCYRDEDLRSDRQPEFTQIDIEMAFVQKQQIFELINGLMEVIFRTAGKTLNRPYPILDYAEAMERFGTDKPDFRFGMELVDLTQQAAASDWPVLREGIGSGNIVKGLVAEEKAGLSRKQVDEFEESCRQRGAKRLFWLPWRETGLQGGVFRQLGKENAERFLQRAGARQGDGLFFLCEPKRLAETVLGALRLNLADQFGLRGNQESQMLWVQNFPLFDRDEASGGLSSCHHPFTSPSPADLDRLETEPLSVRAQAYDLVMDGEEIGGGSIRIHQREIQERVFRVLGISAEKAAAKFGFLLQALRFGAPPHGGIALGLDRIIAILTGAASLRDVIAFPKTSSALCLMTGSPSAVENSQLQELHISLRPLRKRPGDDTEPD